MTAEDHLGRPRVVVTGVGLRTAAGHDLDTVWETLVSGRSTAAPITAFDVTDFPVGFACEIADFELAPHFTPKDLRKVDRPTMFGFAAAADAVADAVVDAEGLAADPARCGVVVGTGVGGFRSATEQFRIFFDAGPERVSPFLVPLMMPNATAALVGMRFGWTGPNLCITTACAAGANALGEATRLLQSGVVDCLLAGGTEAVICGPALAGFWRMGALSTRNDDPSAASRPFDAARDGFVMGEGAGFVVLETLDSATARGAHVYGEIRGYARNTDAFHITAPAPDGSGAAACMLGALDDAGLQPYDVAQVSAHGTSTPLNDRIEAEAIRKVFGASCPPVTSNKGCLGHLVGAAGAVEAIVGLAAAARRLVPPTANHETTDGDIDLDIVSGEPRAVELGTVLSNSFGFGGHNACLVLEAAA